MNANRAIPLLTEPVIQLHMDERSGSDIDGPSPIRIPDRITMRLGRYDPHFADHEGAYIRLAYADTLAGAWHPRVSGTLTHETSHFATEPPDSDRVGEGARRSMAGRICSAAAASPASGAQRSWDMREGVA